jgi:hypothetical protein
MITRSQDSAAVTTVYECGLMGDEGCNLNVDLNDYAASPGCATGSVAEGVLPECQLFYSNGDDDVDEVGSSLVEIALRHPWVSLRNLHRRLLG